MPLNLPGFNLVGAIKRVGGNRKLLCKMLHKFSDDYASVVGRLDALALSGDVHGTLMVLHSLRGVSSSLGISLVYDQAIELENSVRAGQFPVSYEALYHALRESLSVISQAIKKPAEPIKPVVEYDQKDVAHRLNELAASLKKHKVYPKESLDALTTRLAVKASSEMLSTLCRHIDNFNYKGAQAAVYEIAGNLNIAINT